MTQIDISTVTKSAIEARSSELSASIVHTPVVPLYSPLISSLIKECGVHLKLECLQHTGTFKARGALSVAHQIPQQKRPFGITAASAGNHAIASAWAAQQLDLSAKVVMQSSANPFRIARARAHHAEVILKPAGAATFGEAERLVEEEGRTFIHPFEGLDTTLGTAGVGLEFLKDVPELDALVVAVGGGGLISGVAAAAKLIKPDCKVYGVEPIGAASMSKSLEKGEPVTLESTLTIADSLAPPMALPFGYTLCRHYVDEIVTVTDDEICAGMAVLQEEAKLAVEPAAGAAMAAFLGPLRESMKNKRVGIVICGANIDAQTYGDLLARGRIAMADLLKS